MLHAFSSEFFPSQSFPPLAALGFEQFRVLCCCPPPQVSEHDDHCVQSAQLPPTMKVNTTCNSYVISKENWLDNAYIGQRPIFILWDHSYWLYKYLVYLIKI